MKVLKSLNRLLSWPIPYWLTPIGVLLLVGYWYGFSWKISTENWPFWLWLVDKGITVVSIIWAAYFAQSIFNKNAKLREDRERRLRRIEEFIEILEAARIKLYKFGRSTKPNYKDSYMDLMEDIIKLKAFSLVYFPGQTSIEEFVEALSNLHNIFPIQREAESETVFQLEKRLIKDEMKTIIKMRSCLADELCSLHQIYESA